MSNYNPTEKPYPSAPPSYDQSTTGSQYGFHQPPVVQQPQYIPTPVVVQPTPVTQTVVVMGGCPACRVGTLQKGYTCCGILCAIFCFPCGVLCCLLCMKEHKCANCGATF